MHDLYAGIRNKDVETAKRGDRVTNAGIDLILIGYVHADGHRRFAARQGTRGRARGFKVEVGYDDPTLRFEVTFGDGVADAAGCACDEGNFSVEVHGGSWHQRGCSLADEHGDRTVRQDARGLTAEHQA